MWFFTADLHLRHNNIIKYCNRPFTNEIEKNFLKMVYDQVIPISDVRISDESTEKMTDAIIDAINHVVKANDNLVIIGDFCHTNNKNRTTQIKELRDRINCNNVYLILGNHDDREYVKQHFICYDQYTFNINGQQIFTCHYPCRSWNKKTHGSWMLYGHTHGYLSVEDDGKFLDNHRRLLTLGFSDVLAKHGINNQYDLLNDLLAAASCIKGLELCLDVGVDNIRPNTSFGTPWSITEISKYMLNKKNKIEITSRILK